MSKILTLEQFFDKNFIKLRLTFIIESSKALKLWLKNNPKETQSITKQIIDEKQNSYSI